MKVMTRKIARFARWRTTPIAENNADTQFNPFQGSVLFLIIGQTPNRLRPQKSWTVAEQDPVLRSGSGRPEQLQSQQALPLALAPLGDDLGFEGYMER